MCYLICLQEAITCWCFSAVILCKAMIFPASCVDYWITDLGVVVHAPIFPSSSKCHLSRSMQIPVNIRFLFYKKCKYDIVQQLAYIILYSFFLLPRYSLLHPNPDKHEQVGGTAQEKQANVDLYLQNPCVGFPWVLTFKLSPFSQFLADILLSFICWHFGKQKFMFKLLPTFSGQVNLSDCSVGKVSTDALISYCLHVLFDWNIITCPNVFTCVLFFLTVLLNSSYFLKEAV